jgi:hypothetical protein
MTASERIKVILQAGFAGEGLDHVQIRVDLVKPDVALDFAGKRGWLRYQSNLQHSQSLQPFVEEEFGIPIAGEWRIGNKGTARLTIEEEVQKVRIISEREPVADNDADWHDVLAETVAVYSRTVKQDDDSPLTLANYDAGQINHRIY